MSINEKHNKIATAEKSPQQLFLQRLKETTLPQHQALERNPHSVALISPNLSFDQYRLVLQRFYGFVVPLEEQVYPLLNAVFGSTEKFKRTTWLREDLQALGMSAAAIHALPLCTTLPDPNRAASSSEHPVSNSQHPPSSALHAAAGKVSSIQMAGAFGIIYVLEGSKLGGQFIRRHVEAMLGLTPAEGLRFFNGHGKETGSIWNEFRNALADFAVASRQADAVISSAADTFDSFKTWLESSNA